MEQRILVADDEESIRKLLSRSLENPYHVSTASNGRDALALAERENFDLILLDINMPGKTGWEVLKELRQDIQTRTTPVILLTGNGGTADKVEGLNNGADDYVTKPFALEELRARVDGVLRRNRLDVCANPLTKLPGNPAIEEEVNRRIHANIPFAFFYIDIDRFKSFNDAYGFARGDAAIRRTAGLITESLKSQGSREDFAGHIGGDDFVVICEPQRAPHIVIKITSDFDEQAPLLYDCSDRRRGYVETANRTGQFERFALVTLSVGIVTTEARNLDHYGKAVMIASEMKSHLKRQAPRGLSRFAFDRRKDSYPT
ncbi:MAG: hypothetical protein A3J74_09730 [Elusimicrobia bacterium RIFCSPHIGHO2_02_FULL_57_9]|nr:MAG: hypothetical protein A3J74_09730 [Elusimicrobia bacterium RIFCSPHIGHO2_02_FULL_57_9]